jgi:hypothetical protein
LRIFYGEKETALIKNKNMTMTTPNPEENNKKTNFERLFDPYAKGNMFEELLKYKLGEPAPEAQAADLDQTHRVILDILAKRDGWTYVELQSLFLSLRHLIEIKKAQGAFQVLNFYCNWCAHVAITQSAFGFQMLEQINNFFLQFGKENIPKTEEEYAKELTAIFSFDLLIKEITELLKSYDNPNLDIVANPTNHPILKALLYTYVASKSISFGSNYENEKDRAHKYYTRINEQYKAMGIEDLMIMRITITYVQNINTLQMVRKSGQAILLSGYLK